MLARAHPGRYAFHDLLRAYATDLAHTIDSDQDLDNRAGQAGIWDSLGYARHHPEADQLRTKLATLDTPPPGPIDRNATP